MSRRDRQPLGTFPIAESGTRYQQWVQRLMGADLLPTEHLLPQLRVPCARDLPSLMRVRGEPLAPAEAADLAQSIAQLKPWGYGIQLAPGLATEKNPEALERMIYRSHLISGAVKTLLGPELSKCSVVDFACNHGYFSLELAHLGARSALGVDLRQINVDKATLLKNHFGVQNATFRVQDIYDLTQQGEQFDVVLNLGVFYHITDPFKLAQLSYDLCTRFAVFDSIMHKEPVPAYIQRSNKDVTKHAEGRFNVELHPTYRAMIDLLFSVGFHTVIEVTAQRLGGGRDCPHALYDRHDRRCLIGIKGQLPLPNLVMPGPGWQLHRDAAASRPKQGATWSRQLVRWWKSRHKKVGP